MRCLLRVLEEEQRVGTESVVRSHVRTVGRELPLVERRWREARTAIANKREATRLGGVWLELKYIPDRDSDKLYGPYLYARWREGGRQKSRYLGKRLL